MLAEIDMDHLTKGVHARIRSTGAGHGDRTAVKFGERCFQPALHGLNPGLTLKAREIRAVIFDGEAIAVHDAYDGRSSIVPMGSGKPRNRSAAAIGALPGR